MPVGEAVAIPMSDLGSQHTVPNVQSAPLEPVIVREGRANPQAPVFGAVNTAISAGPVAASAMPGPAVPSVQVITPPRRGVPIWLFFVAVLVALAVGLASGFLLATL
jgi:hypothetical protein